MKKKGIIAAIAVALLAIMVVFAVVIKKAHAPKPETALKEYFTYIEQQDYETMYSMLSSSSRGRVSKEDFVSRNKNIYEGIEAKNINIEVQSVNKSGSKNASITYNTKMDTIAGSIEFTNTARLVREGKGGYALEWSSNCIFPDLNDDCKVRIKTTDAQRGSILDRNGVILAAEGDVSSVGIVPGKLGENKEENIEKITALLDTTADYINDELSSSWVQEDTFVPIKEVSMDASQLKEKLLEIPGIMITTTTGRIYPYKEAASHLIGYVQSITQEELEANGGKGYNVNSVIGKSGMEKLFEDRLRGINGEEIYIVDGNGDKTKALAQSQCHDGENIKLTIDMSVQTKLYEQLKEQQGLFVVMQPLTGELLAMVSTPSYDANDFSLGIGTGKWNQLKNNDANPLYTRFLQSWCPGSTFKPVIGAIGLTTGKLSENDEFSYNGLTWQKDSSWGDHNVTTLSGYSGPKNLKNALIHSDNIYFAQAALKIGSDTLTAELDKLLFNKSLDMEYAGSESQYSNSDGIDSDTLLADSGYGQGQILVNPIHMASIYSAFVNEGNMIKPYIEYKEDKQAEYLVEGAFSKEAAEAIKQDLIQVIEDKEGTAHDMKVDGVTLAGKTGTAEIKNAEDEAEENLGWFNFFTADPSYSNQLLAIGMVENAQDNGGSHYLIRIIKTLFQ